MDFCNGKQSGNLIDETPEYLTLANVRSTLGSMDGKLKELESMRSLVQLMLMVGKESDKNVLKASELLKDIKKHRESIVSISEKLSDGRVKSAILAHIEKHDTLVELIEKSFDLARSQRDLLSKSAKPNDRPLADFLKGPGNDGKRAVLRPPMNASSFLFSRSQPCAQHTP